MHSHIYKLTPAKLLKLKSVLTEAAMAHELGAKPREVFRRARLAASVGYERKLYKLLERVPADRLDALSRTVASEFGGIDEAVN